MHFSCNSDFNSDLFFYFVLILLAQKCCWNWHFITLTILYMLAVQRKRSNINCTDKACDNTQIKTFSFSVGSFQLNSAVTGFRLSYRDRKLFPYQQFIHCTLKSVQVSCFQTNKAGFGINYCIYCSLHWTNREMDGLAEMSTVFLYFDNLSEALFQTEWASIVNVLPKDSSDNPWDVLLVRLGGMEPVTIQQGFLLGI